MASESVSKSGVVVTRVGAFKTVLDPPLAWRGFVLARSALEGDSSTEFRAPAELPSTLFVKLPLILLKCAQDNLRQYLHIGDTIHLRLRQVHPDMQGLFRLGLPWQQRLDVRPNWTK